LQPIEDVPYDPHMTDRSDHERPHLNSYWVRPGLLLAGEYPGAFEEAWARRKVRRMLEAGIRVFVDLTEDGELAPYDHLVMEEARALGVDAEHLRFPIRDVCVPETPEHVESTLDAIDAALDAGRAVYVHCWGGIGRTGTIVGCYLVRHGRTGDEALEQIAEWWTTVEKRSRRPRSPETDEQCDYVRSWRSGAASRDRAR
jgi:hypothetical protein